MYMKNTVNTPFTRLKKSGESGNWEYLFSRLQHHFIKRSEQAALRRAKTARGFASSSFSAQAIRKAVLASSAS
jgi:hypothetical protein